MVNGGCDRRAADSLGVPPRLAPFAADVRDVPVEAGGQGDRRGDVPRRPWDRLGDTPGMSSLAFGGILAASMVAPGLLELLNGPALVAVVAALVAAVAVAWRWWM